MGAALLRIHDLPLDHRKRRVEVAWQEGATRRTAAAIVAYRVGEQEAEKIRWYLEDYPEYPSDPAPILAANAEARLAQIGVDLFQQIFTSQDAAAIWAQAQAHLSRVRVEVDADPAEAPGLPWELLRDPNTDTPLALGAATFVRTHLQTAGQVSLPKAAGDQLRVLLVICRPSGRDDVPFRSVASRLVRGGAIQMPGLHLDVLRPATYNRLIEVLHQTADAGRPYHVVHFDGHGTYLDLAAHQADETADDGDGDPAHAGGGIGLSPLRYGVSVAGPVRAGRHGYLIFEDPGVLTNQQLVDGPTLGRLLTATGVPVLVLNACRSAYADAQTHPVEAEPQPENTGTGQGHRSTVEASGVAMPELAEDVHARIRAYGSLAAEVADAGVPGVVAMRYNVYVVTAAQYVADLYAHLLAGKSLGQAASAGRRALAANPTRQISATPVAVQDWTVPIVYEFAPLTLLDPVARDAPVIQLTLPDNPDATTTDALPRPPDAGFFGRDETFLALDRAFDTQQVVLLHAYAGAGKTTTAAEFARWYQTTGGLHHPVLGTGPVLWSSFEHYLPEYRLFDAVGDAFSSVLEANGIHWQTITDPAQRRDVVLQALAQVPVLWVWDNIEPVTGFPADTPSAWTQAEQGDLAEFLRDLAQRTRCKVLLTSRREEQSWLVGLPVRIKLPPMPMRERLQLAGAIAARHGRPVLGPDWRPLLRFSGGNPLAITVLVGQALREGLTTAEQIEAFVSQLRAGEAELEPREDAALGRTRSLAASLSYGFTHAFTGTERVQLAVLHLFRDTVDADALRLMGSPDFNGENALPQLAGLSRAAAIALLDRAADIGLLSFLGAGYYSIHPALPWYFTMLFTGLYGPSNHPDARRAVRAYTHTLAKLGDYYHSQSVTGASDPVLALSAEEANLRNALSLARADEQWDDVTGCLQGLRTLYQRTGRNGEWARLVGQVLPDFIDPATDGPLSGHEDGWELMVEYRVELATLARDWPTATHLQHAEVTLARHKASGALATPDSELTEVDRRQIKHLAIAIEHLGHIFAEQHDARCLPYYQEAFSLLQRIGASDEEAKLAGSLGNAYRDVPGLRDLDQAERWFQHGLNRLPDRNRVERGKFLGNLASVSYERLLDAFTARAGKQVVLEHVKAAMVRFYEALQLIPADHHELIAILHNQIGLIYRLAGERHKAVQHFQEAIKHQEIRGDTYRAGAARYNIALSLKEAGWSAEALQYAYAALRDFQRAGAGASQEASMARELVAGLEHNG